MLNITRKVGEKIIIGDDVVLEVVEVSGSTVRLGIRAPRTVPVYREEIWEAVRAENAAAAKSQTTGLPQPAVAGRTGRKTRPSVRSAARPDADAPIPGSKVRARATRDAQADQRPAR